MEKKLGTYYQCKGIRMALGHVNENVQNEYSKDLVKIFKKLKIQKTNITRNVK